MPFSSRANRIHPTPICHVDETRPWRALLQQADLRQFQHDLTSRHREVTATSKHSADMVTSEIEKLRAELRYQNEKVSSSQKLDMNLERGRIRAGSRVGLHSTPLTRRHILQSRIDATQLFFKKSN